VGGIFILKEKLVGLVHSMGLGVDMGNSQHGGKHWGGGLLPSDGKQGNGRKIC